MNFIKALKTIGISAALGSLFCTTAFAGQWVNGSAGWWYDNGDGTYPANTWKWIDGNGDNISECYYFDAAGYCVLNGMTPDGYQVDQNGAWIENGIVQTKAGQAVLETQISIDDNMKWNLGRMCSVVYDIYTYRGDAFSLNIRLSDMTLSKKADLLYGYKVMCADPRIVSMKKGGDAIKDDDLNTLITELFGPSSQATVQALIKRSITRQSNGYSYFDMEPWDGDVGSSYLGTENLSVSVDNGRVKVEGNIMETKNYSDFYAGRKFTAYFIPNNGLSLGGYRFDQLIVE